MDELFEGIAATLAVEPCSVALIFGICGGYFLKSLLSVSSGAPVIVRSTQTNIGDPTNSPTYIKRYVDQRAAFKFDLPGHSIILEGEDALNFKSLLQTKDTIGAIKHLRECFPELSLEMATDLVRGMIR